MPLSIDPLMKLSEISPIPVRTLGRWFFFCLAFALPLKTFSAAPAWWTTRGVIDTNQTRNDFAAVNTGQLKHIAQQAMLEMDDKISGGAGTAIHALVDSWDTIGTDTNDFAAVNVGQVKAVAKLFYTRLNAAGYTIPLPWDDEAVDRNDYAMANVGQLKAVFAFTIVTDPELDTDSDGLPDWWESLHGLSTTVPDVLTSDTDADGLDLLTEYLLKTNPNVAAETDVGNTLGLQVYSPGL